MTISRADFVPDLGRSPNRLRPERDIRWGLREAAVTYGCGSLFGAATFALSTGGSGSTTVAMHVAGLVGLWSSLLAGIWLSAKHLGSGLLTDDFAVRVAPSDIPLGIVVGITLQLVVVPVVSWPIEQLWNVDMQRSARDLIVNTAGPHWVLYAAIIIGAPIIEELFFRGLLLRALARRLNDPAAMVVCSALFAATHMQPAQFPGLFLVGLGFALLTRDSGRLGPAIVAHMAFNATGVWIIT